MIPVIPDVEDLEKVSSAEVPSHEGARWITLQIVDHIINSIAGRDNRNLTFLPTLMSDFLDAYQELLHLDSVRPLPNDIIQLLIDYSFPAARKILKNPRSKMVKESVMVSPQKLKSPSGKTMSWLAKQPGRTIKEKIGVRNKVLSQVNQYSFDTMENQVTLKFLYELRKQIEDRLERGINEMLYDYLESDCLRYDRMEEFLNFVSKIRNTDLADVKPFATNQPNNILISDKSYSVIWRSYQELISRKHKIEENWEFTFERYISVLYLALVAILAEQKESQVIDRVLEIRDHNGHIRFDPDQVENDYEISFLLREDTSLYEVGKVKMINKEKKFGFIGSNGTDYHFNPYSLLDHSQFDMIQNGQDVFFLTKETPKGKRAEHAFFCESLCYLTLRRDKETIEITLSNRQYNRDTSTFEETDNKKLVYKFDEKVAQPLERGRGLFFHTYKDHSEAVNSKGSVIGNYADMKGMRELVAYMINEISKCSNLAFHKEEVEKKGSNGLMEDVAFDFMSALPSIRTSSPLGLKEQLFTVDFTGKGQLYQPKKNTLFDLGHYISPLNSILFTYTNKQKNDLNSFNIILKQLSKQLQLSKDDYFIYTIPDSIDEFSQNDIKQSFGLTFKQSYPVWRSIAAAMSWRKKVPLKHDQSVLVIDTHDEASNAVLLKVVHNKRYQDIFFEHYAPYSVEDDDNEINLRHFTKEYLSLYVEKYHLEIDGQQKQTILNSGVIEQVLIEKKDVVLPVRQGCNQTVVKFFFDGAVYHQVYSKWYENLSQYLMKLKEEAIKNNKIDHVLFISDHIIENREILFKFSNIVQVNNLHVLKTNEVLAGATEINSRLKEKLPTWYEYLPNLSLEVIKGGHYAQLSLIEDESIENVMGEEKEFKVKEVLTLEKGLKHYDFPLIKGSSGKNNIEFNARIKDDSFPLSQSMNVNLSVKYRYGYENSYKLVVTPAEGEKQPFKSIVADWVEEIGSQHTQENYYPAFPNKTLIGEALLEAIDIMKSVIGRMNYRKSKIMNGKGTPEDLRKMEDQFYKNIHRIRSLIATGGPIVEEFLKEFHNSDLRKFMLNVSKHIPAYLNTEENEPDIGKLKDTSLLFLSSFGPYVTEKIFQFVVRKYKSENQLPIQDHIQRFKAYGSLVYLNGDKEELLDKIIEEYRTNKNFVISFTLRLPIWNDSQLIHRFYERDSSFILKLIQEIKFEFRKLYLSNYVNQNRFRDYCEVLLAILRLRVREDFQHLKIGSTESNTLAKYIRKIDATLFKKNSSFRSRLKFHLSKPETLANMSDLAYACNLYLTGDEGINLIQVSEVEETE